jgi:glycosyltransferase involved in cell wall biosynthesis
MGTDIIENQKNEKRMRPYIICLTPVKNEAWILGKFIQCASLWADLIIIADQMSTDGSREIALEYPKVQLIDNKSEAFNEPERQKMLLDAVKLIQCQDRRKLLITLDADEFLSGNYHETTEWKTICEAKEGTIIEFDFLNIHPNFKQYWLGVKQMPWGFVNDNISQHEGQLIHSYRIPLPNNAPRIHSKDIKVLHYQYTDWSRMMSKHRWYQCFEILNRKYLHPITIFRMYHHMYGLKKSQFYPLNKEWFDFYEKQGIDMFSIEKENIYYWDTQVEAYFEQYGTQYFALLNIWQNTSSQFPDPRTFTQKLLHKYLLWSQLYVNRVFPLGTVVRYLDKFLKLIF